MKKIGILGSGDVGKSLAKGFLKHGYKVMMGTRSPAKLEDWAKEEAPDVTLGSVEKTAVFADIIVLAVLGSVAKEVLKSAGQENLASKTVIDTTNPISAKEPENGVLKFFTSLDESLMEQLQKQVPEAHFVKAFNSIGHAFMVNPQFKEKPTMFICGNHASSKEEVTEILEKFGFEVSDMGKVEAARAIEPLCILWCIPGFLRNEWQHAFKLLKE